MNQQVLMPTRQVTANPLKMNLQAPQQGQSAPKQEPKPFNQVDMNASKIPAKAEDPNAKPDQPSKQVTKKGKKGMGRLRMRRGGRRGKLTRTGLDMQSFYKTKMCPYLLAVRTSLFFLGLILCGRGIVRRGISVLMRIARLS